MKHSRTMQTLLALITMLTLTVAVAEPAQSHAPPAYRYDAAPDGLGRFRRPNGHQNACPPRPTTVYRVLRTPGFVAGRGCEPQRGDAPLPEPLRPLDSEATKGVFNHVAWGSDAGFTSQYISTTANLAVAEEWVKDEVAKGFNPNLRRYQTSMIAKIDIRKFEDVSLAPAPVPTQELKNAKGDVIGTPHGVVYLNQGPVRHFQFPDWELDADWEGTIPKVQISYANSRAHSEVLLVPGVNAKGKSKGIPWVPIYYDKDGKLSPGQADDVTTPYPELE